MLATDLLPSDKLNILQAIAADFNTDANLILAIGQHETGWGKLGDGVNGMYTGYGSYNSGSDYTKAGFETQVSGTARKMAAWGIRPGRVSLNILKDGNNGLLPTGIYATDHRWPDKVYSIYKSIIDNSSATNDSESIDPAPGSASQAKLIPGSDKSKGYLFLGICAGFSLFVFMGVLK